MSLKRYFTDVQVLYCYYVYVYDKIDYERNIQQ